MSGRYYVQGETVRGEPRIYWVADRSQPGRFDDKRVSECTTDRRQAQRWCDKFNSRPAEERSPHPKETTNG